MLAMPLMQQAGAPLASVVLLLYNAALMCFLFLIFIISLSLCIVTINGHVGSFIHRSMLPRRKGSNATDRHRLPSENVVRSISVS